MNLSLGLEKINYQKFLIVFFSHIKTLSNIPNKSLNHLKITFYENFLWVKLPKVNK